MSAPPADVADLLDACGVRPATLSDAQRGALDEDGFVLLSGVFGARRLTALRATFERAAAATEEEDVQAGRSPGGTRHPRRLLEAGPAVAGCLLEPAVLAAVHHVLRDELRVHVVGGRDPRPGHGAQGLHTDWRPRGRGEPFRVATALVYLDDVGEDNGPTRVVAGTHRAAGPVARAVSDPAARHPAERCVTATAGSVLIFNGHLWHGATRNESDRPRRTLQIQFVTAAVSRPAGEPPPPDAVADPRVRFLLGA